MKIAILKKIFKPYYKKSVLTIKEASSIVCVSNSFLLNAIHKNKLPAFCVGSHYRILKEDLITFIESETKIKETLIG